MTNYRDSASWHHYRGILKRSFNLTLSHRVEEHWRSIRGHQIHIDEWLPDGPARGTVILVHGGGGHGRILAPLGDLAATMGWRALAPDLPGYGLTKTSGDFHWDYPEWPAVVAELADSSSGPVVLIGLSVGGLTAALAAQASGKVSGVIVTTLLNMGDPSVFMRAARWRWLGVASLIGFRLTPWVVDRLALPLRIAAPLNRMSSDGEMRHYFATDPMLEGLRVPSRFFRTMHALKLDSIKTGCPLLLVHPGADAWTPTDMSRPTFDLVQGSKRFRELTNGSHLPLESPAWEELTDEISRFLSTLTESEPQE